MSEFMGWIAYNAEKLEQIERASKGKKPSSNLLDMNPDDIVKVFK